MMTSGDSRDQNDWIKPEFIFFANSIKVEKSFVDFGTKKMTFSSPRKSLNYRPALLGLIGPN